MKSKSGQKGCARTEPIPASAPAAPARRYVKKMFCIVTELVVVNFL